MNWNTFREEVKRFRFSKSCTIEYMATLLLGIAEEIEEYHDAVREQKTIEDQVLEFGHILFNVAELQNLLEESKSKYYNNDEVAKIACGLFFGGSKIGLTCVQAVRKHYLKNRDVRKLEIKSSAIFSMCEVLFTTTPIAEHAMISCIKDLENRGR